MRRKTMFVRGKKGIGFLALFWVSGILLAACGSSGSSGSSSSGDMMALLPKKMYTDNFESGLQGWTVKYLTVPKQHATEESSAVTTYDIKLSQEINHSDNGSNSLEFSLFGDQEYIDAWVQRRVISTRDMSFTLSFYLWSPQHTVYPRSGVLVYIGEKKQPGDADFEFVGVTEEQTGWYKYSSKTYTFRAGVEYTIAVGLGTRWGLISHFYIDDIVFACEDQQYSEILALLGGDDSGTATSSGVGKESFETGWNDWITQAMTAEDSVWSIDRTSREPSEILDGAWTVDFYDQGAQGDTLWIYKKFVANKHIERVRVRFSIWSEYFANTKKTDVLAYIGTMEPTDSSILTTIGTTENNSGWEEYDYYIYLTLDATEEYYIAMGISKRDNDLIEYFLDGANITVTD